MKLKFVYPLFALAIGAFIFLGNSNGRAAAGNEGNTGAPGDNALNGRTCQNCHNGGPLQVTLDIEVSKDGALVSSYIPGQDYDVKVIINDALGNPSGYGFQMVAEIDSDNSSTNSWSNPSSNTKTSSTTDGRSYLEQNGTSSSNEFTATWTAPTVGSGSVTFYSCGNGVNGNGMTSGDGAARNELTLTEDEGSSTFDAQKEELAFNLLPNPVVSDFQIQTNHITNGQYKLSILTIDGKIQQQRTVLLTGGKTAAIDASALSPGYYWVQLANERTTMIGKMLKW
ncbi:MAG: choice-of-anchor V domain-containing protein [Bacteroidota bacterium]